MPENRKSGITYFAKLGDRFDKYMSSYDVDHHKSLVFNHFLQNKEISGKHVLEAGFRHRSFFHRNSEKRCITDHP